MTGNPRADHLLNLIQLNFITGLARNASLVGVDVKWLDCNSISPIGTLSEPSASTSRALLPSSSYPCNLIPTALQSEVPHHPWVDLFPLPRMRDNFLLATASLLTEAEEIQLWNDVIESEAPGGAVWTGFIVWGEPWNIRSWEVTVPFLRRWTRLLDGCPEILQSTNYWRHQRGEVKLSKEWGSA